MNSASSPGAPLAGVRVLDLTRLLPGPMCSLILADMGARVDKIEDPGAGDYLRHMPPQRDDVNGAFLALNRDKRFAVVDLKQPAGVQTLSRLLGSYDVLIESFRPGVLDRLGLSHARMLEVNPALVVCAITGYGQTGPLVHRAGHDINYLARAGVLGQTGPADRPPAVSGAQMADVAGGAMWAAIGILGALNARARDGRGRVVDISMTEGSIPLAAFAFGSVTAIGKGPARGESHLNGGIAAYATYRTKDDRFVSLGALEPKFWLAFCAGVGLEGSLEPLTEGPHQAEWRARLDALFLTRTRDEWAAFGAANDCCLEPVLETHELPQDAQHRARSVFFDVAGATCFRTPVGDATREHHAARAPGSDTDAVLRDAGLDDNEISALRASGAVR